MNRLDEGALWLTLNRPEAGNAITATLREALIAGLTAASERLDVRCVVITGAGDRAFCTGADLRVSRPETDPPEGEPKRAAGDVSRLIRGGVQRLIASVLDCERPVIAAVNGVAAGVGAHLAFACDLVLAEHARFIEVFVRRGITPDGGGAYLLPRLIGLAKATELVFFGDDLPAPEAERIGLVNKVVPGSEMEKAAGEWAGKLATGPTKSIALAKWLLNRCLQSDRETAFAEEAWAQEMASYTEEFGEGIASFKERRPPTFRGW
jgi:2-(1,2-epoxy-1,2-dihydrophenyl)acetyl-CoA isomerase